MKMLYEVTRWEFWLATESDDEFKLNNNFTAYYARLIMEQEPDLAGMFELRKVRGGPVGDDVPVDENDPYRF